MNPELKKLIKSLIIPVLFLIIMWSVKLFEEFSNIRLSEYGLIPLSFKGLRGVLFYPFLHGDFKHLISNSIPFFFLGSMLFYYYQKKAIEIFTILFFFSGILLWLFARGSYPHIGASGIVYALASFHFFSGIIKRETRQTAFAMIVVFLYGGMVWGVFPDFYPERNISWEGHLMGGVAGFTMALYYRKSGPQEKKYFEDEDEDDEESDDFQDPLLRVVYHVKKEED